LKAKKYKYGNLIMKRNVVAEIFGELPEIKEESEVSNSASAVEKSSS
jgi:hypothetical protein